MAPTIPAQIEALLVKAEILELESLELREGGFLLWMPPRKAMRLRELTAEVKEITKEIRRLRLEALRA